MKFRILIVSVLALFAPYNSLQADLNAYQLTWGLSFVTIDGVVFDNLKLDMELLPRFIQASGELRASQQSFSDTQIRVTGSCTYGLNNRALCTLNAGLNLIELNLEGSGSGEYLVKTNTGTQLGAGMAWLTFIF